MKGKKDAPTTRDAVHSVSSPLSPVLVSIPAGPGHVSGDVAGELSGVLQPFDGLVEGRRKWEERRRGKQRDKLKYQQVM
jgi:hypothetical protein